MSSDDTELVSHLGSCHCQAVKFEALAPANVTILDCNCTICNKKQIQAFLVPKTNFELIQGEDVLTTYTYNTHQAKHIFCKICGVQSFYSSRARPDCYGVIIHCLDSDTVKSAQKNFFDGRDWNKAMKGLDSK